MTRAERRRAERSARKEEARRQRDHERMSRGYAEVKKGNWPDWSPFVEMHGPGSRFCEEVGADYGFSNSRYQVLVAFERPGRGWPPVMHLSIKAHDRRCVHDWRDMQRIKNELAGTMSEGVELYPAESRLMDEANQFHLFCLHPMTGGFPIGQKGRTVLTPEELEEEFAGLGPQERPVQREFEDHHGAEGCRSAGKVPWPDWAVQELERILGCVKTGNSS